MNGTLGPLTGRVAAAPISWGVCEVPQWGAMLPAERVLAEMRMLGLSATELGAPGFLPQAADPLRAELAAQGMQLVGGFVPLVLHDPARRADALVRARATATLFAACGATRFVTAAVEDYEWSCPVPLDAAGMRILGEGLAEVDAVCAEHGLIQALHPHVGTLVETAGDVALALEHTDVGWCLDTGHLQIGGVDPVAFARDHADRVRHVHLKDMDGAVAGRVLSREVTLVEAVQAGLFRVLGTGDVDVAGVITTLEASGYQGWYVLEQDTALTEGLPDPGAGPVDDVRGCLDFLRTQVVPRLSAARA